MKQMFISASNRRAVLWVIFLCLLVAFLPRILMLFKEDVVVQISEKEKQELIVLENQKKSNASFTRKKERRFKTPPKRFNPNHYSVEDWKYLGLSEKQAAIVLKFGARGIDNFEELSRIFVIPPALLSIIKDSLVFEESSKGSYSKIKEKDYKSKELLAVDLNSAQEGDLEALPMIGEKLAQRITKYRNRLGGFIFKEQLLEVYGIDANTFAAVEKRVTVNEKSVRKLKLNQATAEELKNHPYFNWNIANSIVKLRIQKGQFTKIEDVLESKLIDFEFFEKVKPYLEL